jgi:putative endonuclease
MFMPYVYILCCNDGTFYTGSTWNIEKRVWEHQNGLGANYTKERLPTELAFCEECSRIEDAFKRERQIQEWNYKKKLALICN